MANVVVAMYRSADTKTIFNSFAHITIDDHADDAHYVWEATHAVSKLQPSGGSAIFTLSHLRQEMF